MRSAKNTVKELFHALGFEISRHRSNQHPPTVNVLGINPAADVERLVHKNHRVIVFDVGANIGQSVKRFKDLIPQCEIHSFEPGPAAYKVLKRNAESYGDVCLNNLALGSSSGEKTLLENSQCDMSSFLQPDDSCWGKIVNQTVVKVTTVDKYCEENSIPYISLLKTDTQGYDFEVVKGASTLMEGNRIQLVLMEVIFSNMYKDLPAFDEIFRFLLDRNFKLVSFYQFHHQKEIASWSDALFLNTRFDFGGMPES